MFCSQCGKEIADNSKFCSECGKAVNPIDYDSIDKAKKSTWEKAKELSEKSNPQPKKTDDKKQYETKVVVHESNEGFGGALSSFISRTLAVVVGIFLFFATCTYMCASLFD